MAKQNNNNKQSEMENLKYEVAQEMGLPGKPKKKKKEKKTYN